MEIIAGVLDWTSNDEVVWAKFLESETGKRLIPKLAEYTPPFLERGPTDEMLVRLGKVAGMQLAVQTLVSLAHPAQPLDNQPTVYPALDDDAAWNDGQKLEKQQ